MLFGQCNRTGQHRSDVHCEVQGQVAICTWVIFAWFRNMMTTSAGLLGLGSGVLKLLLRIPAEWQTGAAFPVGLTEETLISDPIFRALYDLTSIKPFDQVCSLPHLPSGVWQARLATCPRLSCTSKACYSICTATIGARPLSIGYLRV